MNAFVWILQIVLAFVFLMAGTMKVMKSKEELFERMPWVEDFDASHIRTIGILSVLAAIGLILPGLFNIIPGVTPWAALGLLLLMIGAGVTHARRKEWPSVGVNVILGILALIVVWARFGDYAF